MAGEIHRSNHGPNDAIVGGKPYAPSDSSVITSGTRQVFFNVGGLVTVMWATGDVQQHVVVDKDLRDWNVLMIKATGTTATGIEIFV